MRFHHSTRRGRTKFSQAPASASGARGHSALTNRWAQLSYCRQTNIHFHRRLPVSVPDELRNLQVGQADELELACGPLEQQLDELLHLSTTPTTATTTTNNQIEEQLKSSEEITSITSDQSSEEINMSSGRKLKAQLSGVNPIDCNQNVIKQQHCNRKLDIEVAREMLIAQVDKHPFWSNKAAKRMRLLDIDERRILIYELVSYCERRDLEWRYEPYRGGGLIATTSNTGSHSTPPPGTGAVRRVLSSVSERVPPTHASSGDDAIISHRELALPASSGKQQQLYNSASQPVSPLHNRTSELPVELYESAPQAPTLTYSTGSACSSGIGSGLSQRRAHIKRSCSTSGTGNGTGSGPQTPPTPTTPTTPSSQQHAGRDYQQLMGSGGAGEPRPLPSASLVWSIEPPEHLRPAPFSSYLHTTEVPDTSFVKRCHGCLGKGRLKCTSCYGVGYEVCISCSGKGTMKSLAGVGSSSSHAHRGGGGRDSPGGAVVGSMWADGSESSCSSSGGRFGSGRHDEPGGITSGGCTSGSSAWTTESCHYCHGAGQKRCWICAGRAYNTCTACAGTGQLRCYLNLNITWMNHRDECVLNNTDSIIPRDRLKLSSGLVLSDQIAWRLEPIAPPSGLTGSRDPVLPQDGATTRHKLHRSSSRSNSNSNSNDKQAVGQTLEQVVRPNELSQLAILSSKLIDKHTQTYERDERLLRQRQRVTQIEAHLVNWEWKRRRGHFVIYGDERKVYIDKYPFKSICNIT